MSGKPALYSYFRSSASWRVRIALALKGIDYEYKPVNLVLDGGQQHSTEYKAMNPIEQVPVLKWGDVCLTQSLAIIDYLEDVKPEPSIIPKDPVKKAQARALAELICSGTQPMISRSVRSKVTEYGHSSDDWINFWLTRGLAAYEKLVQSTTGKYSVGDEITLADICLIPQMLNAKRFKVDLTQFPNINRIVAAASQLDAFKAADPMAQPDCPEDLKTQ